MNPTKRSSAIEITEEDLEKVLTLPSDHQEKNNIAMETVAAANRKMLDKLGRILHKRTDEDTQLIWEAFQAEADSFQSRMGYGAKDISAIGVKKFVDAMDWRSAADVKSYLTDTMQVVICPHCKQEFGVYQEALGICKPCQPLFDMERFFDTHTAVMTQDINEATLMLDLFFVESGFREQYLKQKDGELSGLVQGDSIPKL